MASRHRLIDLPEVYRAIYGEDLTGSRSLSVACLICPPPGNLRSCVVGITDSHDLLFSIIAVDLNKKVKLIAQFDNDLNVDPSIDMMSDGRTIIVVDTQPTSPKRAGYRRKQKTEL